jgi:putative two-component system response regulator
MDGFSSTELQKNTNTVLFVDDDRHILSAIKRIFDNKAITLLTTDNPEDALSIIENREIAVIVSDNRMPGMTGMELLVRIRELSPDTVKILMTAYADMDIVINAINAGEVFKFIIKPWENGLLIKAVEEGVRRHSIIQALKKGDEGPLLSLAQAIELKDSYTRGHCNRVADYAIMIADALGLQPDFREDIKYGSWLHDCGKIGVPEHILNKPGPLDPEEMEIVKNHPAWGAEVVRLAHRSDTIVNIIYFHHEKFDGTGYPARKKGNDIPLEARIVTIADIFDALTSQRSYRKAFRLNEALEILQSMRGAELDPELLDIFLTLMDSKEF